MKISKRKLWFPLTMFLMGTLFITSTTQAADTDKKPDQSVSVSTKLPDNQIDKNQSFFDLLLEKGQEQELEVVLTNNTDKEVTMETAANTAITNQNGAVDYSWDVETAKKAAEKNNENKDNIPIDLKTIKFDSSLKYPFSTIASMDKEVVVPASSSVTTKVKVKMPDEDLPGVIAGGIYLSQKEATDAEEDNNQGVQIKNKFVYVVGVQMRQKEDISELTPEMKLDKSLILPMQINYRNYLGINLQNVEPVYIRDLTVTAKVYKKGSTEVLHETTQEMMKMAPNSNFNFGVNWDNQEFKGGTYRVTVTARAEDYDKEWSWDEEFTIDKELADKLNNQAVELEKTDYTLYYIIAGIIGLLLLILLIIYLIKRHNDKKKNKNRRQNLRRNKSSKKKSSGKSSNNKHRKK